MEETKQKNPNKIWIIIIVILMLIILGIIGVFIVYPKIQDSKKLAFQKDTYDLYLSSKEAFNKIITLDSEYNDKTSMCLGSEFLKLNGYYDGELTGSVLISYNETENKQEYYVWSNDSKYMILENKVELLDSLNVLDKDKSQVEKITKCPPKVLNFATNRGNNLMLKCENDKCLGEYTPTIKNYCDGGTDVGKGCRKTTYESCKNGYTLNDKNECVKETELSYRCPVGYDLVDTKCVRVTEDATCTGGTIKDGMCTIETTAQQVCDTGGLFGSKCVERYNVCEGIYDKKTEECIQITAYDKMYTCKDGYYLEAGLCKREENGNT